MKPRTHGMGWLWLAGIVLCTLVIWGNSLKDVEHSSAQSQKVLEVVEPVLDAVHAQPTGRHHLVRKAAHALEFTGLGLCWSLFLRSRGRTGLQLAGLAALFCTATAGLDETLQLFVPGRGGQLSDVWIDVRGSLCAIAAVVLLDVLWRQCRSRRSISS